MLVMAALEGSPHYVSQGVKNETAHHKLCQCCKLAQEECKRHHGNVAKIMHGVWTINIKVGRTLIRRSITKWQYKDTLGHKHKV